MLVTDGIVEAMDGEGACYGSDRLIEAVSRAGSDPRALIEEVIEDVGRFTAGAPQSDDLTMVCFSRQA